MLLPSAMTVSAAEAFLRAIADGRANSITLPTQGRYQASGGEAAFVQALATWAGVTGGSELRTYALDAQDVQVDRLVRRLYGLAGTLLADRILARDGTDLTEAFQKAAGLRLGQLQSEDPAGASRGPQLEIVCLDHMARSHPRSFYSQDRDGSFKVKDLTHFEAFAETLVGELVPREMAHAVPGDIGASIGGVLHELFGNTEEHARSDDLKNTPAKSIRGMHARRHPIEPEALARLSGDSLPLASYCRRLRPARERNRDIQLIEIAIFDSGPGLAASISGEPLDHIPSELERSLVMSCFREGVSRKRLSSAGLGLPTAVDLLRAQNGFLRVRTGRQALYADLGLEPDKPFGEPPNLQPWSSTDEPAPRATGTLFTLLFPLEA